MVAIPTTTTQRSATRAPLPRDRATLEQELRAAGSIIKGTSCTCPHPSHDDGKASASVYADDAGAWRIKCHGCGWSGDVHDLRAMLTGRPLADVLAEARGSSKTAPPPPTTPKAEPRKTYPTQAEAERVAAWKVGKDKGEGYGIAHRYTYPGGFVVLRFESDHDKTFVPIHRRGEQWALGDPPGKLALYRLNELPDTGPVWFVEGEKAADALASVGIPATTTAHGSKSPGNTSLSPLAGRDVIIWPDRDDAGAAYAEEVAKLLHKLDPPARVKIITPPDDLPSKGDAFDYIEARDAMEPHALADGIRELGEQAEVCERVEQVEAARFTFYTAAEFDALDLRRDYHIPGILAAGPVPSVLAGSFKTLKTSVCMDMLLSLATGAQFLNNYRPPLKIPPRPA